MFSEFAQIFQGFVKVLRDFAPNSMDFTRVLRNFALVFTKSKLLGVLLHSLHPRLLHQCFSYCIARFRGRTVNTFPLTSNWCMFRFGRRLTFLLFTFLQYILAIITSFATSIELYAVCLFFSGGCAVVNFDAATLLGKFMFCEV